MRLATKRRLFFGILGLVSFETTCIFVALMQKLVCPELVMLPVILNISRILYVTFPERFSMICWAVCCSLIVCWRLIVCMSLLLWNWPYFICCQRLAKSNNNCKFIFITKFSLSFFTNRQHKKLLHVHWTKVPGDTLGIFTEYLKRIDIVMYVIIDKIQKKLCICQANVKDSIRWLQTCI